MKYPEQFKIINSNFVRRLSDGAEISIESGYYQSWLADGNEPEPADPSPAPEVFPDLTPRQLRMALTRAGLRAQVEAAVTAGDQDLKDWWEQSLSFERSHEQVASMVQALGKTSADADAVWRLGATL